jgi:hypothetical protein
MMDKESLEEEKKVKHFYEKKQKKEDLYFCF